MSSSLRVLEQLAPLGPRRARGESLRSWLAAGPLRCAASAVLPALDRPLLYCPCCWLREGNARRWFTRLSWEDARAVVCSMHGQPLRSIASAPARLAPLAIKRPIREELKAIAVACEQWSRASACVVRPRPRTREDLVLRALVARTWLGHAYSAAWSLGQWRLWSEGWPVPPCVRSKASMKDWMQARQGDRLGLMCTAIHIASSLERPRAPAWPGLPLRPPVFRWLTGRMDELGVSAEAVALVFTMRVR
jgi:hypothetical protein